MIPEPSAPPSRAPVIEVVGLSTRFGESRVHEDIHLTVYRGEGFDLAGGNG